MTTSPALGPATRFTLPPGSDATEPPERRGVPRDGVRLLVARGSDGIEHRLFHALPDLLQSGDLLVVNTSATLPAAVKALRPDTRRTTIHVSTALALDEWVVEVRQLDQSGPDLDVTAGAEFRLPAGVKFRLTESYPDPGSATSRLWRASIEPPTDLGHYLARHGGPIRYDYLRGFFPLSDHQTVFATHPGSAEMASAGRPFTPSLVVELVARGVTFAPVMLHASVSSPELSEPPLPERFVVPEDTARLVASARAAGRRVVAVGTTVVRALETAADPDGSVHAAEGWTDLILGPDRPARTVTGLITGLHAPQASHLLLLEAVAGQDLVGAAYSAAVERRYLWHEFGDSTLFLP